MSAKAADIITQKFNGESPCDQSSIFVGVTDIHVMVWALIVVLGSEKNNLPGMVLENHHIS